MTPPKSLPSPTLTQHAHDIAIQHFPSHNLTFWAGVQGGCSHTFLLTPNSSEDSNGDVKEKLVLQLRPRIHALDASVVAEASRVYGDDVVPSARILPTPNPSEYEEGEWQVVCTPLLPGTPYSRLQPTVDIRPGTAMFARQVGLVGCLARFIGRAWTSRPRSRGRGRADSPFDDSTSTSPTTYDAGCEGGRGQMKGKVGGVIRAKLRRLAEELEGVEMRARAGGVRRDYEGIMDCDDGWPVVLTHGDLIASNILIADSNSDRREEEEIEEARITGVVDWAEAEWLPFGVCLYAVEQFLGFLDAEANVWRYYACAGELRRVFYEVLCEEVPELKGRLWELGVMGDVGVLLWYGYAWDGGRIDRVVNSVDDGVEVECLRAWLS
ncbi:hypothetical protein BU24DRAFT_497580 [Aaosphaeria arxii CBS 175.79]|uniref:Aminoglycoside phosphotransferase domain-containing protein n=1 Tax=Aaosphaeria arxii CBS 175.79 TaxID=1450172 RepID=A0A6A5X7U2_9PLEO|nr:uncharacterized protein BU24DRAFT_497580 [Aaosphaeria arxii CBS 175.79]KAF2009013.1 hypothetical protein BU24DRAFT_497580 [Aaosphaeria arxii CBS 175.79]